MPSAVMDESQKLISWLQADETIGALTPGIQTG